MEFVEYYEPLTSLQRIKLRIVKSESLTIGGKLIPKYKHVCDQCGKSYMRTNTLKRHIKYECGKPASFCCTFCTYRAKRKDNLRYHINNCQKRREGHKIRVKRR
ncbi:PREDICTED: longitudinals lacking protein, isoforms A/B/D/L-like [Ceratosolen solmsi marchali]|uniref:Longitudinals lacking protein, isoforms A/B/D/L-like n=1 Tax=Ceratosolen solmsi marchali TaxID=326594 RepID=A0AAJ7E2Y0_9HYME|nr:PREDICTED: longitudinals lacking protein, isoforms A/B/D/L-like [Ceratosolen solmsi marchali]